ncbi:hypothetical protein K474DRAFT_1670198 [Panus rudis PR-1116 ss-1]|nr:hypothetical protein K474DRAFT_1670198 [Panus rudis PR-1116 ss-1]
MFRLPTHLESFIPPPREQVPHTRPWRGTLVLPAPLSSNTSIQELSCTAAETEGDSSQVELWPLRFVVQVINQRPLLHEVQAWVKAHAPPMCMLMPDRLQDPDKQNQNQAAFEALASLLAENNLVAVAPWNLPDRLSGAGILLFPTRASRTLLVAAVFVHSSFPEFLNGLVNHSPRSSTVVPRHIPIPSPSHSQPLPNIATSQRHASSQSPTSSRSSRF